MYPLDTSKGEKKKSCFLFISRVENVIEVVQQLNYMNENYIHDELFCLS